MAATLCVMPAQDTATIVPPQLDEVDEGFIAVFAALSEPLRMQIVRMIAEHDEEDFPCTALDDMLPIAKSTISYHVQVLRRAGLLLVRKAGRNYFYRLSPETFEAFAPGILEHFSRQKSASVR